MAPERLGCGEKGADGVVAGATRRKLPVAVADRISRSLSFVVSR